MTCFDLLGTGSMQLIIGWESGKVLSKVYYLIFENELKENQLIG